MPIRHPIRILLAGLALGLTFDRLLAGRPLGASFPLFLVLVLLALSLTMRWESVRPLQSNLWVFVPLLFFAVMVSVRANAFVTFLNVSAVILLLGLIAVYLARAALASVDLPGYAVFLLLAPTMSVVRGAQVARQAAVNGAGLWQGPRRQTWTPVLRGLLLALPIVVVFALLLSSADLMFAEVLRRLLPEDLVAFVRRMAVHGSIVLSIGFILMGGLAYTVWRDEHSMEARLPGALPPVSPLLGLTESAVVLNAVNLLFAAFVVIQIPYLFGGQLNIDLGRITYAEYARRGFGELVFVSVLVLGLLLLAGALTRRQGGRQTRLFNLSSTVTVGLTVVMLVSAFKRLLLYEMAYGFTEMRIYPHVFMIWLALLLGWFLVTLWLRPGRFAIGVVVACLGFVATLNVLNVDDFIVRRNVERYEQLGSTAFALRDAYAPYDSRIDPAYLTVLSEDAIPALVRSVDRLAGEPKREVANHLRGKLLEMEADTTRRQWPAFHLAHRRAHDALAGWAAGQ